MLSIGPTETMHFQTWQDKAGNAPALRNPDQWACISRPQFSSFQRRAFLDQSNHARAVRLPEPVVEAMFGHPAGLDRPSGLRRDQGRLNSSQTCVALLAPAALSAIKLEGDPTMAPRTKHGYASLRFCLPVTVAVKMARP
jgi:hypothetical protein